MFQRTPNFAMPARNRPLDEAFVHERKATYRAHRAAMLESHTGVVVELHDQSALAVSEAERDATYEAAWDSGTLFALLASYNDLLIDPAANETAAEFVRGRIRELVHDPEVAELLSPRTYPFGAKRACLDTDYYATFNRPNVSLVDVRATPIVEITPTGLRTTAEQFDLDALVFATGFDAMTGPLLGPDHHRPAGRRPAATRGRPGRVPTSASPSSGFPNLFTITGPGSPSVLTNMIVSIEQHVDWVAACIDDLRERQLRHHRGHARRRGRSGSTTSTRSPSFTLYPPRNSWYMGANVPGKPRVFMPYIGGVAYYREVCADVAADDYRGFALA